MSRSWFKCTECGIECDNSVRAPENAPGEPNKSFEICQICDKSFCPVCDSLYDEPTPTPMQGWMAHCVECGRWDFFNAEIARNIVELNHRMRKETTHDPR